MDVPATRYARNGSVHLAFQVAGDAPRDLLFVTSWLVAVEHLWAEPRIRAMLERLASFSRLILFDRRGSGMSDRLPYAPLEEQVDDLRAVLAAAGSERVSVFAESEGTALATMFAATTPQQVDALALWSPIPCFTRSDDYPLGFSEEEREAMIESTYWHWGEGLPALTIAPSMADDPEFRAWFAKLERMGMSPGAVRAAQRLIGAQDVRSVLPLVQAPTLVLLRSENTGIDPRHGRYIADHIPGAQLFEVPGRDQLIAAGDSDPLMAELERFLGVDRPAAPASQRILATVLFTDIVGSTEQAARLGDRAWARVLEDHRAIVRAELALHGGREVKTLGDGFLAVFDGPARGIRAGLAIADRSEAAGVRVRAGLHTGECEVENGDVSGIAVHIAARVLGQAGASEVLVSRTVADLVVGSGLGLRPRGTFELRGVPGAWELYAARATG